MTCPYGYKTSYSSEEAAKHARNALSRFKTVSDVRIYQCPNCYQFHFTSRKT